MDFAPLMQGRSVFVTGASSGIGAHLARLCAHLGAKVAVAARRTDALRALEIELRDLGATDALALSLDVADAESVEPALRAARQRFGALDVVLNNAGIAPDGAAIDTPIERFDHVLDVNLRGAYAVATAAARIWREDRRGGSLINVASILGLRQASGVSPYAISKAGVVQMTKVLALEWARHGIRVNALAPGYIDTPMTNDFFATDMGKSMVARIPMRRIGKPEDLDGPFLLLATDASAFMTGAIIPVDGGHVVNSL
jgi:NAD(P)-dependent dehydrogenase (short-subunit alcohol dehydrogenase family)